MEPDDFECETCTFNTTLYTATDMHYVKVSRFNKKRQKASR